MVFTEYLHTYSDMFIYFYVLYIHIRKYICIFFSYFYLYILYTLFYAMCF